MMVLMLAFAALSLRAALAAVPAVAAPTSAPPGPSAAPAESASAVDAKSPRVAVGEFLDLARQRRFPQAARYLDLGGADDTRGAVLAQRLKAVLDRHLWIDLDAVSAAAEGDRADGLPAGMEELGTIGAAGRKDPVRMTRTSDVDGPSWVFSRGTVSRIDSWYDALPDRVVREWLPPVLLRPGPHDLLRWQWVAFLLLAGAAVVLGASLAWLTERVMLLAARGTRSDWDDALVRRVRAPIAAGWALVVVSLAVPVLRLYAPAQAFVTRAVMGAASVVVFWAVWRSVDVAADVIRTSSLGRASASARSLVFIGSRLAKAAVAAIGAVTALSLLGYPVAGLLAGLGIGGLALALAAQKTVENLFGSVALAVDQPFRVGDFVKVEDFVATVEEVGLRSTRFRTLDRTLISIPNGRVADMRLESYTARDRMRLSCTIGLVYATTAAQMREVLAGLEAVLRAHPKIWPEAVVVRLREFAPSSLDIEVMAWFETPDWPEFQLIRQEVLLQFLEVVERAGTTFAFPTRTVHHVALGASASVAEARASS
jgi:MscS family membrane protein